MSEKTILVVDDSSYIRKVLKMNFEKAGFRVILAENGEEAYEIYKNKRPDIVTMDILMPILDGLNALKKILGEFGDAKIVMISSINEQDKVFEAIKAGAKNYILKPIEPKKIMDVINQVIAD